MRLDGAEIVCLYQKQAISSVTPSPDRLLYTYGHLEIRKHIAIASPDLLTMRQFVIRHCIMYNLTTKYSKRQIQRMVWSGDFPVRQPHSMPSQLHRLRAFSSTSHP